MTRCDRLFPLPMLLILSSCMSGTPMIPAIDATPGLGDGVGSQHGNYAAREEGEMRGPSGERCVVFSWDRPLSKDFAIRLRSASCESLDHPGKMVCTELSRTIIPLSESAVRDGPGDGSP
jgi:hypothetical protein